jgi:hypothetical protein
VTYYEFIELCKHKKYENGISLQEHHIVPRSVDPNSKETVLLSLHDHYWAHVYWAKEFKSCLSAPQFILHHYNAKKCFDENQWDNCCKIAMELIKEFHTGRKRSEETRKKISDSMKGKVSRKKGFKHSETAKEKMRKAAAARKMSETTRKKMSESRKQYLSSLSKEEKDKQCSSFKGKKHSKNTKDKMSKSAILVWSKRRNKG